MLIKKSESTVAFHKNEMKNAMSQHLPTVDFEMSYSKYNIDNPTSDYNNDEKNQFMFVFRLPLFQGGYTLSKTKEAKMKYQSAMEDLADIRAKTNIDYEKYKSVFDSSMKMLPLYQESLENANLYKESIEQGYNFGLKSILDVYDANNKLYEVKYEYLDNLYELIDAYVNLLILTNNFDDLRMIDFLIAKK
jgi:outer membrane protein